ncbi:MAG: hypothetical protein IPK60_17835 [Sandaracinaceae bacterium]|nr:hypothetical protein [Sandaracinaceae bacterium]
MKLVHLLCATSFLAGCAVKPPVPPADLAPLAITPAFAVVTSDRASTAIAMLDENGTLITEAWIDSGTTRPILSATLDGDVVMPTLPVGRNVLNLINQLGATVITRIAIPSGDVIAQFAGQRPEPEGDAALTRFRANIQDMLDLHDGTVLVTRFEPNRREGAQELDLGNDAVVIRLSDGMLMDRISFDAVNLVSDDATYYARPSAMVPVGERVVVATTRLDQLFNSGAGAVAVIDVPARTARAIELPGFADCLEAVPVPSDATRAVVLCQGDTFTTMTQRRAHAGLVLLNLDSAGEPQIETSWRASEHPSVPVPSNGLVALSSSRVVVNAMGDRSENTDDTYLLIDFETGAADVIFMSSGAFVISKGAYVAEREQLLVPDATNGVRIFAVSDDGALEETRIIDPSPYRRLPAREIRALLTE